MNIAIALCLILANLTMLGLVLFLLEKRRLREQKKIEHILERLRLEHDQELERYRGKIEGKLTSLYKICERASQWIERSPGAPQPSGTSSEEIELRSLTQNFKSAPPTSPSEPRRKEKIPSVEEFEKIREQLKNTPPMDLKTLLSHQLG